MKNIFTMMMLGMFFSAMVCATQTAAADPLNEDEVEAGMEWIKSVDKHGKTYLHYLVYDNNKNDIVRKYIDKGADVNAKDRHGRSPMHYAAAVGNIEAMNYLYDHHADIEMSNRHGKTPLYYAVKHGQVKAVKWFREKGVIPNGKVIDILNRNIKKGCANVEELKEILLLPQKDKKFNLVKWIKSTDKDGKTPLHHVVYDNNKNDHVKLYIDKGADVDAKDQLGRSPMHYAAIVGNIEAMDYLYSHRADIEVFDKYGKTPLYYAAQRGQIEAVKWFLGKSVTPDGGIIDMLKRSIKGGYGNVEKLKEILPLLQESRENKMKGDILLQRKKEKEEEEKIRNELSGMFKNDSKTWPEQLVDEAKAEEQKRQINKVARRGNFESVKAAIDNGADVNAADRGGRTPMHRAAEAGNLEAMKYLLDHGANLITKNKHGKTPLYYAAKKQQAEAVKWLLANGVKPDEKTISDFGNTESEISKLLRNDDEQQTKTVEQPK